MMKQLRNVVRDVQLREKFASALREEISTSISPRILVEDVPIDEVCRSALDEIAICRKTGKRHGNLKVSTLLKMSKHPSSDVRRLSAALLPESQLPKLAFDPHWSVRSEVAQRTQLTEVKKMMRRFPSDINLKQIYEDRTVLDVHSVPEHRWGWDEDNVRKGLRDIYSKERDDVPLTDAFYTSLANHIFGEFKNLVAGSEAYLNTNNVMRMADIYARHSKPTNGVEIDRDKLIKAIEEHIEDYESRVLKKYGIEEVKDNLAYQEMLQETVLFAGYELDDVEELLESTLTSTEFVNKVDALYDIREAARFTKKQASILMQEGTDLKNFFVPVSGKLLQQNIRRVDERVLDRYCEIWNERRTREGSIARLDWSNQDDDIVFEVKV